MSIQGSENSRFSDLSDEPIDHLLSPIEGYENLPLLSLSESVKPVAEFFNEIEDNVFVAFYIYIYIFSINIKDDTKKHVF